MSVVFVLTGVIGLLLPRAACVSLPSQRLSATPAAAAAAPAAPAAATGA